MGNLTNRQLLEGPPPSSLLTGLEKQRQLVLRINSAPRGCPSCGHPSNVFEATGVDVDAYDFSIGEKPAACPACKRPLKFMLPMFAGSWHWAIDLEREKAAKPLTPAKAYEIASQWGSYVRQGDPGACFYSFKGENDARPVSEAHREACLNYTFDRIKALRDDTPDDELDPQTLADVTQLRALWQFFSTTTLNDGDAE